MPSTVLGEVLRRARESLGRSPEQVGAVVGIAGRTIRRLEAGESDRPRRVTLETLAGFYGLEADALIGLADAPAEPVALLQLLRDEVAARTAPEVVEALEGIDDEPIELAMRWARSPATGSDVVHDERLADLIAELRRTSPHDYRATSEALWAFVALDRARKGLVLALLRDLRSAQHAERRRPV